MAMQIVYGYKDEEELVVPEQKRVYLTENLRKVCGELFIEEIFFEDDEEVIYEVILQKECEKVNIEIDILIERTIESLKIIKGNEEKSIYLNKIRDYMLLKTQLIEMLLLKKENMYLALV